MAGSIATAFVQVVPTTDGITNNLEKAFGGSGEKAGETAGKNFLLKFGKMLAGSAAAKVIYDFFKESINQGAELQQNIGGTVAVWGRAATDITSRASQAYKNMGMSASDYMATANKMGALFQGSGLSQVEAMRLTTKAMQRAADVASVMGIDTSAAMEAIAGAAKGNFTMMDNLGVAMNATTLKAYALEKGINFDWNTATQAEKSQLAMEMFFDRTSQYAANFSREAETTISGSLGMVKASWSDFLGKLALGEDVTGAMRNLFSSVKTFATGSLFPAIGNIFSGLGTLAVEGIQKLGPIALGTLAVLQRLGSIALTLAVEGIQNGLQRLGPIAENAWNDLQISIADSWGEIISDLSGDWERIKTGFSDTVNSVKTTASEGWEKIKTSTTALWTAIQASIEAHGGGIKGAIGTAASVASSLWNAGMSAIDAATGGKLSAVTATVSAKMSAVKAAFSEKISAASAAISDGISKIKSLFNFSWSLPSLKLPHFTASGAFSLNPPSVPTFSISWYKKAYENPLVFTSPTVLPTQSGFKGFGDGNGAEVVMGLSRLRELVGGNKTAPAPALISQREVVEAIHELRDAIRGMKICLDGDKTVGALVDRIDAALGERDGLTERGIA